MTEKDKTTMADYTRLIADKVGLKNWTFDLFFTNDPFEPDKMILGDEHDDVAEQMYVVGQRHALLRYTPGMRQMPREKVRHTVTHELVHLHLAQARELCRTGLVAHLGAQGYTLFMHAYDLQWEHAVDAIAVAWAPSMPLIDWREERRETSARKKASRHRS